MRKRAELPDFYSDMNFYWVGATFNDADEANKWEWISHYQQFKDYTNWYSNEDGKKFIIQY